MKIQWYQSRYLICPVCNECSPTWFYLKEIKGWVKHHNEGCGATSFKEEGYVEVVE